MSSSFRKRWLALGLLSAAGIALVLPGSGSGLLGTARLTVALALAGTAASLWWSSRRRFLSAEAERASSDPDQPAPQRRAVLFQCTEDVRAAVEPIAIRQGVRLQIEYVTKMPVTVGIAPGPLRLALIEVLRGALHATKKGTVLALLYCWREDGEMRLEIVVMDAGSGIAPAELRKAFDRWDNVDLDEDLYRIEAAQAAMETVGGGLVTRHWPGIGTVIRLEAPAGPDDGVVFVEPPRRKDWGAVDVGGAAPSGADDADLQDRLVLIASDSPVTRRILRDLLTRWRAAVKDSESAVDALESFQAGRWNPESFDAILVEVDISGTDGFQVVRQLRRLGVRRPIVAVTAAGGSRETYLSEGFDDWVARPIDPDVLLEVLSKLMNGAEAVTRLEERPDDSR